MGASEQICGAETPLILGLSTTAGGILILRHKFPNSLVSVGPGDTNSMIWCDILQAVSILPSLL